MSKQKKLKQQRKNNKGFGKVELTQSNNVFDESIQIINSIPTANEEIEIIESVFSNSNEYFWYCSDYNQKYGNVLYASFLGYVDELYKDKEGEIDLDFIVIHFQWSSDNPYIELDNKGTELIEAGRYERIALYKYNLLSLLQEKIKEYMFEYELDGSQVIDKVEWCSNNTKSEVEDTWLCNLINKKLNIREG